MVLMRLCISTQYEAESDGLVPLLGVSACVTIKLHNIFRSLAKFPAGAKFPAQTTELLTMIIQAILQDSVIKKTLQSMKVPEIEKSNRVDHERFPPWLDTSATKEANGGPSGPSEPNHCKWDSYIPLTEKKCYNRY